MHCQCRKSVAHCIHIYVYGGLHFVKGFLRSRNSFFILSGFRFFARDGLLFFHDKVCPRVKDSADGLLAVLPVEVASRQDILFKDQ